MNPRTLAKTLSYVLCHAPGEYGLFWDEDGTMPWKELYWAMQEDPSLRFVRQSHLREIAYLDIDFPAVLDGQTLRLKPGFPPPVYPIASPPPSRLFFGCRRRALAVVREHGLHAAGRPYVPVSADRDLALRIARRRETEPVLIDILADAAARDGVLFRSAGASLYLVESLEAGHLRLPLMRQEKFQEAAGRSRKEKEPPKREVSRTPGSFTIEAEHLQGIFGGPAESGSKGKAKGRSGAQWKRESRGERNKRNL